MATPPDFVAGQVLTAAQLNKIGMWEVGTQTSFSAASSVLANNVFTSDYEQYLLLIRYTTTSNTIGLRLRVSGTSAATNYNAQFFSAENTTVSASRSLAATDFPVAGPTSGTFWSYSQIWLSGPQLAEPTVIQVANAVQQSAYNAPRWINWYGNHSTSTAYDGFELLVGAGTMTGNYTLFGVRK